MVARKKKHDKRFEQYRNKAFFGQLTRRRD